jgi:hypothetical protein
MELTEGSETSAISNQTPGKHPKENILHVKHGESLKSRILLQPFFFHPFPLLVYVFSYPKITVGDSLVSNLDS